MIYFEFGELAYGRCCEEVEELQASNYPAASRVANTHEAAKIPKFVRPSIKGPEGTVFPLGFSDRDWFDLKLSMLILPGS